ncbi:MAG TPA: thiamine phosphate synthase [Vicinamibacterales bacterium]|nr:thiamine phosphate synthase [Vicinamibacterales bacterium]
MAWNLPIVCVITRARGETGSAERGRLLQRLSEAADAGASIVQVRERQLDDRRLAGFVGEVKAAIGRTSARVLVNDRTDIALAAGADGVHLKSDGPPMSDVRRIVRGPFVIGRSVHSVAEAAAAARDGCDYLLFGTVFPSRSKPDSHPIAGVAELADVCRAVAVPVIAIGGITPERAAAVREAGAAGVAAISLFADAPDTGAVVAALRSALTLPRGNV